MTKALALLLLLAGALVGCTASGLPAPGGAAAAIAADLKQSSDAALLAAHPQLVRRKGPTLIVGAERFTDEGDCGQGDCTRYRADGMWHGKYVGIDVSHYEGGDYILAGAGDAVAIGSRPISSPSGRRFFTGHQDDRDWTPYQGAAVWDWHEYPRRLRLVDTHLVVFHAFTSWHADACVEFTGSRGGYGGGEVQPVRTFWLAEEQGDWRLSEERPSACR